MGSTTQGIANAIETRISSVKPPDTVDCSTTQGIANAIETVTELLATAPVERSTTQGIANAIETGRATQRITKGVAQPPKESPTRLKLAAAGRGRDVLVGSTTQGIANAIETDLLELEVTL